MCIIQDSAEDWDHEAALMCEVYKYALLNVSADDSLDARGGCFKDRAPVSVQPFKLRMLNMDSAWWVTVDERSMFEWVEKAPISKRAWVYQERQLSRRVLHFTKHEVFWECCAKSPSFASETYPAGSPLHRDFVGQTKIELPPTSGDTLVVNTALSETWDDICEDFSTRNLSYNQDKLPALAGLAKEFGTRCPSDTYLAGLWSSRIPQQLLWDVIHRVKVGGMDIGDEDDTPKQPAQPLTGYVAPSWSWLSVNSPISMNKVSRFHSLVDIIDFDYRTSTANPYGRIKQASIKIRALSRPITIVTKPSPFEGDVYDNYAALGVEKSIDLYVNEDGAEARKIGNRVANAQQFFENEDRKDSVPDTRSYLCMLVAVTQYSGGRSRELKALLLEPTEHKDHFRRAGIITLRGGCALRMRYKIDEDSQNDNGRSMQYQERIAPIWGGINFGGGEATKEVSPKDQGPMSLYEFDDGAECTSYHKLMPREITLV